jgi:hypothetical protein
VNAQIPIAADFAHHTVDLSVVPFADDGTVDTVALFQPGLRQVNFFSITLQAERVILDPTIS